MESYIQISKINDFIFCPRSVYLHTIYDNFHKKSYQRTPQIAGTIAHESIDTGAYSSRKRYLMGKEVYSDELSLCGKIDIYDLQTKTLIERKRKVVKIYDGYKYQLYAQMACMREMGFEIETLKIHSLSDNKSYILDMPNEEEWQKFIDIVERVNNFSVAEAKILADSKKCAQCIYQPLCHPL